MTTFLLVPGAGGDAHHWDHLVPRLAELGHTAIPVDLPAQDESAGWAEYTDVALAAGSDVVRLDLAQPFTAARARNAGFARLREIAPEVAWVQFVDAGRLRTTFGEHFGTINAANLRRAHAFIESGKARGKVVLAGF